MSLQRRARRQRTRGLVVVLMVVASVVGPVPAWGHSGSNLTVPVLEAVTPALPDEVTVELVATQVATLMAVSNPTDTVLEVAQRDGTPWLRISAAGVEVASGVVDTYASTSPTGGAVPQEVLAGERENTWVRVTTEPRWSWFEHRLHPEGILPQGIASATEAPVRLLEWAVPLRYGDLEVRALGSVQLRPATGTIEVALTSDVPDGVDAQVIVGGIPGILLTPTDAELVQVFGLSGEEYLRFLEGRVEVDVASPTHRAVEAARGNQLPPLDGPSSAAFEVVTGGATYLWLEPRAQAPIDIPADVREGDRPVDLVTWEVPLVVDGERTVLAGVTRWIPARAGVDAVADSGVGGGGAVGRVALVGLGLVLVLAAVLRRRAR